MKVPVLMPDRSVKHIVVQIAVSFDIPFRCPPLNPLPLVG